MSIGILVMNKSSLGNVIFNFMQENSGYVDRYIEGPAVSNIPRSRVVKVFDYRRENLKPALRGVEILILIPELNRSVADRYETIMQIANEVGVKHIIQVSCYGASPYSPFYFNRLIGEADAKVIESGIPYTVIRNNIYLQIFSNLYKENLKQGVLYLPSGEGRVSYVDVYDVAEAIIAITMRPAEYEYRVLTFTGGNAYSLEDVLDRISIKLERRLEYVPVTADFAHKLMLKKGLEEPKIQGVLDLHESIKAGKREAVSSSLEEVLERKPRSLEAFLSREFNNLRAELGRGMNGLVPPEGSNFTPPNNP